VYSSYAYVNRMIDFSKWTDGRSLIFPGGGGVGDWSINVNDSVLQPDLTVTQSCQTRAFSWEGHILVRRRQHDSTNS